MQSYHNEIKKQNKSKKRCLPYVEFAFREMLAFGAEFLIFVLSALFRCLGRCRCMPIWAIGSKMAGLDFASAFRQLGA